MPASTDGARLGRDSGISSIARAELMMMPMFGMAARRAATTANRAAKGTPTRRCTAQVPSPTTTLTRHWPATQHRSRVVTAPPTSTTLSRWAGCTNPMRRPHRPAGLATAHDAAHRVIADQAEDLAGVGQQVGAADGVEHLVA